MSAPRYWLITNWPSAIREDAVIFGANPLVNEETDERAKANPSVTDATGMPDAGLPLYEVFFPSIQTTLCKPLSSINAYVTVGAVAHPAMVTSMVLPAEGEALVSQ